MLKIFLLIFALNSSNRLEFAPSILYVPTYNNVFVTICKYRQKMTFYEYFMGLEVNQDPRWKLWINDLIGWSQYPQNPFKFSSVSPSIITIRNSKTRNAIVSFLKALEVRFVSKEELPNIPKPKTTEEGRKRFLELLKQMNTPLLLSSVYYFSKPTIPVKFDSSTELIVRKWINGFEKFPIEHPEDCYLSRFARLYSLILRLHWDSDISSLSHQFVKLKHDYKDDELISVMSDWYNSLLLCYLQPHNQTSVMQDFCLQNKSHLEWYVVQWAYKYMFDEVALQSLVNDFFCSAIRRNSK